MRKLIIWNDDWADEFNIFGIEIIHEIEYNELINKLKKAIDSGLDYEREYYFGTNEFMTYRYSEILWILENSRSITEEEYDMLKTLKLDGKGQTFLSQVEDELNEENDESY